jgi:hypothetical protein
MSSKRSLSRRCSNRRSENTRTESSKRRSDRRDDRTGQGYAAGERAGRDAKAKRRGAGVLRCSRNQRQRRASSRRQNFTNYRALGDRCGPQKRHRDWTIRENVRAQLRVTIKRILRKYGYPPDNRRRQRKLFWNRWSCWVGKWQHNALTSPSMLSCSEMKIQI